MKQSSINHADAANNMADTVADTSGEEVVASISTPSDVTITAVKNLVSEIPRENSSVDGISRIGIVGLGLIGGSLLRTIRRFYPDMEILGIDSDQSTTAEVVTSKLAVMVDSYEQLCGCQIIFVCVPVGLTAACVRQIAQVVGKAAIITDVASVKGMLSSVDGRIIGGHPMAGTENSGFSASCDTLFERAPYILVDYGKTGQQDYELLTQFVASLNVRVIDMQASDHDNLLAGISHLPHMIAYSLSNLIFPLEKSDVAGRSLSDVTRIASSSPKFWREVTELNSENILASMDSFIEQLQGLRDLIDRKEFDSLENYFLLGKNLRERHTTK